MSQQWPASKQLYAMVAETDPTPEITQGKEQALIPHPAAVYSPMYFILVSVSVQGVPGVRDYDSLLPLVLSEF